MEKTKSTRIEEFSHYSMASLAANYAQRLQDAANDMMQRLMDGGTRDITPKGGIWWDPATATDYQALRVYDNLITVTWQEMDGEEREESLDTLDLFTLLRLLERFSVKLADLAWDKEKDEY